MTEVIYRPCKIEHIRLIEPQEGSAMEKGAFLMPEYSHMVDNSFAISAWVGLRCIGAAGILPIYSGRSIAWAFMSKESGKYMRQITRKVRAALDMDPTPRIEMLVNADFADGHRWAKMLGFELEAERMRKHGVNGNDESLYARIK